MGFFIAFTCVFRISRIDLNIIVEALTTGGFYDYGRQGTSTTYILQKILTKLEESYHVFTTPTGFGSVFLSIFSIVRPGDEIIVADPVYSPTRILTEDFLKEFKIKTIFYDPANLKTLENNISKKTKLIFVENPGSNSFEFQDLGKIISIAKKNKIITAIDNTWATPYYFKPIKFGFDMSIVCLLYTSPSPRDGLLSRMPSSA